jgi:outer membrane protein OmpA-like peptidoglycan-associated protein
MANYFGLFGAAALVGLSGCATVPAALEQARINYKQAQQDPHVSSQAPVALYEATQTLLRAERTWEETGNEEEVKHLAYLTNQRVEIARERAQQKIAEAQAKLFSEESEKVRLEARTREAERAKQLAEARAREAEQARQKARMSAEEAEQARRTAQAQARQADLAHKQAEARAREVELAQQQAEARAREAEQAQKQAWDAIARAKQLEEQLAEFKAKQTERGFELTLQDVLFELDKANLKPGAMRSLAALVEFLRKNPDRTITIEGHTDSLGSHSYNLELSQRRADAVRDFLVRSGISADRVVTRGLGEAYPVASNDTQAGRQQNRRVEIIISHEAGRTPQK